MDAPSRFRQADSSTCNQMESSISLCPVLFFLFFFSPQGDNIPIPIRTCSLSFLHIRGFEPAEQSQTLANHQLPPAWPREMNTRCSQARSSCRATHRPCQHTAAVLLGTDMENNTLQQQQHLCAHRKKAAYQSWDQIFSGNAA